MTLEEEIKQLKQIIDVASKMERNEKELDAFDEEALNMAIKALEQEPCEDAISRQAVLDIVDSYSESQSNVEDVTQDIMSDIMALSSVKQESKTGHWITKIKSDLGGDMWPTNPKCSECGREPYYSNTIYDYKFCPYCGARMAEPQEMGEKEYENDV